MSRTLVIARISLQPCWSWNFVFTATRPRNERIKSGLYGTISARRFALAAIAYRSPRHFAIFRANDVLCILPWSIFVHDSLENDYYYRKAQMLSAQITFLDKFLGRLRYRLTDIAIFDSSNVLLSHKHSVTRTFRLCGTFLTDPGDVVDAIATQITGLGTPRLFTPSILCHGKESFFVDLRLDRIRSAV